MSRVLKFRAWDKAMKAMRPVWSIGWKAWDAPDECINTVELERDGTVELAEEEVILMQFTGLLDRHGTEIYEGDVIKYQKTASVVYLHPDGMGQEDGPNKVLPESYLGVVEWKGVTFWCDGMLSNHTNIDILGNCYEHPHLLTATS